MQIEFFFDFSCPFSYVGFCYLKDLRALYPGIGVVWRPCEAHPANEPRMSFDPAPPWLSSLERAAKLNGIPLHVPDALPYSNIAVQGMFYALDAGMDPWDYIDQIFRAVFVYNKDIEDMAVFEEIAAQAGIDPIRMQFVIQSQCYEQIRTYSNIYAFEYMGLEAVPSIIKGDKRLDAAETIGLTKEAIDGFLKGLLA